MQTIEGQLSSGQLARLQLLYGEERYMVKYYKKRILKVLDMEADEMNCSCYEGGDISISEVIDVAQTLPFFAEKRLILIENSGFFKSANDFVDMMEGVPDTTYIVFVEKEVDKRNRLYKYLQKNGCVTEAKQENQQRLVTWVARYLKSAGKNVSQNTVIELLQRVGTNMDMLSMELEKVIGYVGDREAVEISDLDAVCTTQVTGKIFEMVDAVAERNCKKALAFYRDLLELKEPPMRILFLFSRHVNIMLQLRELKKHGTAGADLAKKVGVPPFAVNKYLSQARNFSDDDMIGMLKQCVELEESVKTGRLSDQMAVELFIVGS